MGRQRSYKSGEIVRSNVPDSKFDFLAITQDEILRFHRQLECDPHRTISHNDLLVYMVIINALRVVGESKVKLTSKWYRGIPLNPRKVGRSLSRLEDHKLVTVLRSPRQSPVVGIVE